MELTEAQYDRLITMLADNRVAVHTARNELGLELAQIKKDLSRQIQFLQSSIDVIDADLTKVQSVQREQGSLLGSVERMQRDDHAILMAIDQSLEGVTQLGKTSFDMIESLNKHVLGESSNLHHGDPEARDRAELG